MSDEDPLQSFRHDVRSPLNAVLGFAMLLEAELDGDQLESAAHIRRSAEQILALVDGLGPNAVAGATSEPSESDASAADEVGDGHRVVLVEDNRSNVRLVERILGHRPSVSLHALHDVVELRDWLQSGAVSPALILLDRHLAGEDALRLLPSITDAHPGVPVVVVTADATEVARDEAIIAGAVDVLTKPFSVAGLLETVDHQLSSSSSSGSKR
ncbi:MAG: response regulator [Actinomycetota bacterium]